MILRTVGLLARMAIFRLPALVPLTLERTINLLCPKLGRIIVLELRLHSCKMIEHWTAIEYYCCSQLTKTVPLYSWHSSSMIGQRNQCLRLLHLLQLTKCPCKRPKLTFLSPSHTVSASCLLAHVLHHSSLLALLIGLSCHTFQRPLTAWWAALLL